VAPSGGVSGLAVGVVAVGGLLTWSAIRNVTPIDTLKEVLGKPSNGSPISTPFGSTVSGVRAVAGSAVGPAIGAGVIAGVAGGDGPGGRLVAEARKLIGVPYVWAAASASGVDCSGLVVLCLRRMGEPDVPRFTTATFGAWAAKRGAVRVKPDQFRAGDVILRTGHMGIAVSATALIHAPTIGDRVKEATIWDRGNWWGWRLFGAVTTLDKGST
jgi:cell wall-associated NlpC family hydrolase